MKSILAIIGAPGTGKSTLMKKFMENWEWDYDRVGQLDHYKSGDLIVLGVYPEGNVFVIEEKKEAAVALG